MRRCLLLFSGCALVVGCASPSPQPKPSHDRYVHPALVLAHSAFRKESI